MSMRLIIFFGRIEQDKISRGWNPYHYWYSLANYKNEHRYDHQCNNRSLNSFARYLLIAKPQGCCVRFSLGQEISNFSHESPASLE